MSERVRIEHYEAEDVRRILANYGKQRNYSAGSTRGDYQIEDLVNAIGEVYERALARRHSRVNDKLAVAEIAEAEA
jgi:hypothetical protein